MFRFSIEAKSFGTDGESVRVLSGIALEVPRGEIVSLYGPSGCGKSTLLRILAGFDTNYAGIVTLDDTPVTEPTSSVGMVVQGDSSYRWLTVADNIAFGLRYTESGRGDDWLTRLMGRVDRTAAREQAEELAELVGLSREDLNKYPHQMSGGMKQRMAFARALLPRPEVLLLDEPFGALDFEARQALQDVVLRIRERLNTSFICVSHDPEEVLYLADRILVLSEKPATVRDTVTPALPHHGSNETRYTVEFLEMKRKLREKLDEHSSERPQDIVIDSNEQQPHHEEP